MNETQPVSPLVSTETDTGFFKQGFSDLLGTWGLPTALTAG